MRTSSLPYVFTVSLTMFWMLVKSRVSTGMAVASPPASLISRSTVLIVDAWEFGFGGNGVHFDASEVVLAATTTIVLSAL
jgi:hypothetical protein